MFPNVRLTLRSAVVTGLCVLALPACGDDEAEETEAPKTGTLVFTVNAEDFARHGFVSEDGWRLDFTHTYINIQGVTAFQVAVTETPQGEHQALRADGRLFHAGHPHAAIPEGSAHEALTGEFFVDGHQGDAPIEIGRAEAAPIGNYNFLNFVVQNATSASVGLAAGFEGYSIVLVGTAVNDRRPPGRRRSSEDQSAETVAFTIKLDHEMTFTSCGPHPENLGVVAEGGQGEAQATFHFDHIFGDAEEGPAEPTDPDTVNAVAIGFGPFAALATNGVLDVTQADLQAMPEYDAFVAAVETLGHFGEAHCLLEGRGRALTGNTPNR